MRRIATRSSFTVGDRHASFEIRAGSVLNPFAPGVLRDFQCPALSVGFYGKLPARGDFVRVGLPRDFTDPWDDWLQSVLAGSRALMGEAWLPAFLEAPVWRFALPPGMCGAQAVLGLMLPSVDRAGRYFPLTFAALQRSGIEPASGEAWLDACEAAGRDALEQDTPPQEIADMLGVA